MLKCLQIIKILRFGAFWISRKKDEAKCRYCPKLLSCKGGSTVRLKRHLEKVHNIILQNECEDDLPNKKLCIQSNLDSMIKKKYHWMNGCLLAACFAAVDGFSIRRTTKSDQTCELLREK